MALIGAATYLLKGERGMYDIPKEKMKFGGKPCYRVYVWVNDHIQWFAVHTEEKSNNTFNGMDERRIPLQYDKSVEQMESVLQQNMRMELYTINSIWNFLTDSHGLNVTRENFYAQVCVLEPLDGNHMNIAHIKVPFRMVENIIRDLLENKEIPKLERDRENAMIKKIIPLSLSTKEFYLKQAKYQVQWNGKYKLTCPFFELSESGFEFSQNSLKLLLTLVREGQLVGLQSFALLDNEYRPLMAHMLQNLKVYLDKFNAPVNTRVILKGRPGDRTRREQQKDLKHKTAPLRFSLEMLVDFPTLTLDKTEGESGSPVECGSVESDVVQIAVALLNETGINVQLCLKSNNVYLIACLEALKKGCSTKYAGSILADVLVSGSTLERDRLCARLKSGGYFDYTGEVTQPIRLRHGLSGKCALNNDTWYIGTFVGGRMMGKGRIENRTGCLCYEGDFLDNRPHGYGRLMKDDGISPLYEGHFASGKPHGKGTKYVGDSVTVEGVFISGQLSCLKGRFNDHTQNIVYTGGFFEDKMHGYGILKTSTVKYEGMFLNHQKCGIGLHMKKGVAKLSVWWKDVLMHTLQSFSKDITLEEALKLFSANQENGKVETASQTYCEHELDPSSIQPTVAPEEVQVYSLCALTKCLPRKEFVIQSDKTIEQLEAMGKGIPFFFFENRMIPSSKQAPLQHLHSILLLHENNKSENEKGLDSKKGNALYFFRCPVCVQSEYIIARTNSCHSSFEVIECTQCQNKPNSCLLCKICASVPGMQSNAFFRIDPGMKHLQSVHGVHL
eukprot:2101700-Rhodomonas_salina.2